MKILMTACTIDEEGKHFPGEVIEINDAVAEDYLKRGLALPAPEEETKEESGEIETAALAGAPENTLSRRGRKPASTP